MNTTSMSVECPECGQICGVVSNPSFVWVALKRHRCQTPRPHQSPSITQREEPTMNLQSVPEARPPAASLVDHEDKRIAKAAQKVLAAEAALDAAWEANSAKAELRAKAKVLEAQLAEIKAQIKGAPVPAAPADKVDYKAVRAWAAEQGYEVAPSGQIPKAIMADYLDATSGGAA